jgi:glutamate formiminotransferase/formiminotetrahydrofolate cyclodeaminase
MKMNKIVECVPNFSEGREPEIIEAIAEAIRETSGCTLIDVDPGRSTNRTVYTFVGDPEAVIEGALAGAHQAKERIDMRRHKGEHPRFGAMDVCPFIPVQGVSMNDCVQIAKTFAERIAEELNVPIFLYEEASNLDYRRKLPDIREGEYEALPDRLKDPRWKPDFGPDEFLPSWGATAVGARRFLIAYNVNILGTSNQAHRIALNLREAGRGKDQPGRLKEVKGMGWYVKEYNLAQVTVNLTDYRVTPIHKMFEAVKKDAAELNVGVAGSEIVGVVPLESLLMVADHYIDAENLFIYEEDQKIRLAIERLGLNAISPFNPKEKIIEYIVAEPPEEPLAEMSVRGFIEAVAARTSAPGGGSVSAAAAAMGAGLGTMVAKLTYGVRKFEHVDGQMRRAIPVLHEVTKCLISMIDADTASFNVYVESLKMPSNTEDEKALRAAKIQEALKVAAQAPLKTMRLGDSAWQPLCEVARHGNPASGSDVLVGARVLEAGIWGAYQNVLINMIDIKDDNFKTAILGEAESMAKRAAEKCAEIVDMLESY